MQPLSLPTQTTHASRSKWATFRTSLTRIWRTNPHLIRLRHWEYWPFEVVYFPIFFYWLWLSLKARSLFFFSASNPSIQSGGLLGESKQAILDQIPDQYKPRTLFVPAQSRALAHVLDQMRVAELVFPVIAKPNVGERGWRVERIDNLAQLAAYLLEHPADCIIQEYIDEPLEFGVFYYRLPGQPTGVVSSIVQKEFLRVRGNGRNCIEELIMMNERAILQLPALQQKYGDQLHNIPAAGEVVSLVMIGNHSRGTKFLDANHLITPELTQCFDQISQSISGFYYGRYDLRCRTLADLHTGDHLKIMELNGAGAEPAHIYQPGFSLWQAYRVLFHHWHILYRISRANHQNGTPYMTFSDMYQLWQQTQQNRKA